MNERIDLILDNVLRIWEEFLIGSSPIDGIYLFPIIAWLALGWMLWQTWQAIQSRELKSGPIILLWLIGMSILIATLDTAFWHFKRYQLPMMVLFFPLAGWTLTTYLNQKRPYFQYVIPLVLIANGVIALSTFNEYARRYEDNVAVVQNQQIRLAEYINNNVESDAVIAVHDVGILRYIGQRTTYDVVGLTTEGTASAWRQGPGTLYELLKNQQPDYFAIYPDIQGLPLLVEAGVYGETEFAATYDLPENTAASATSTQLLTVPDWQELTTNLNALHQPISNQYADNFDLVGVLNVADLKSEADYDYEWTNTEPISGFATAVRRLDYHVCSREDCELVDGTRILNGGESFDLPEVDEDFSQYLVILRVHAATPARLNVGCGGDALQTLVVPQIAGEWVEIPVLVSAEDDRFCVDVEGTYEPALYWIFAGNYAPRITAIGEEAKFQLPNDDGAVTLKQHMVTQTPDEITIDAIWSGSEALSFDGKVFIHLYEDASQPPVRQVDRWVAGALPPSNWLVGDLPQTYRISTTDLPSGIYRMAIGFYNPVTGERYQVNGAERYFIESIVID